MKLNDFITSNISWYDNKKNNINYYKLIINNLYNKNKIQFYNNLSENNILDSFNSNEEFINKNYIKKNSNINIIINLLNKLYKYYLYKNNNDDDDYNYDDDDDINKILEKMNEIKKIFKINLSYIKSNNLFYKYLTLIINNIKNIKNLNIDLLSIYIDQEDINKINKNYKYIWYKLFEKINDKDIELIKFLIPYLTNNDLNIKHGKYNRTSWHNLFEEKRNYVYSKKIITLLIQNNFLKKEDLKVQDNSGKTCWHYIFKNAYYLCDKNTFNLLLTYLDKEDLSIQEKEYHNTCWYYIFDLICIENFEIVRSLIIKYFTIEDFNYINKNKFTYWHILFNYYDKYH